MSLRGHRFRANSANSKQTTPHYGLGFQLKVLTPFTDGTSTLGSGSSNNTQLQTNFQAQITSKSRNLETQIPNYSWSASPIIRGPLPLVVRCNDESPLQTDFLVQITSKPHKQSILVTLVTCSRLSTSAGAIENVRRSVRTILSINPYKQTNYFWLPWVPVHGYPRRREGGEVLQQSDATITALYTQMFGANSIETSNAQKQSIPGCPGHLGLGYGVGHVFFLSFTGTNPSAKCSQERLTRGTITSTMRRAAHPSERARCATHALPFRRMPLRLQHMR